MPLRPPFVILLMVLARAAIDLHAQGAGPQPGVVNDAVGIDLVARGRHIAGRVAPTHHYPFNVDASDVVGGANGVLVNGARVVGGALRLDGVDDFVQFNQKIVPTAGSYTVLVRFAQTTQQFVYMELISQGFSNGAGFYIGHDPCRIIRATDGWMETGVSFPSDGRFHQIALAVDAVAGRSRLYLDGRLSATLNLALTSTSAGNNTRFGRQFDPYSEFFHGAIDEIKVFNQSLSADAILATQAAPPSGSAVGVTVSR